MFRNKYWSCTKFADRLRGTPKPESASGKEWELWRAAAQLAHPVRYWIAETALDNIRNFIFWPSDQLYSIKYWLVNRFVTRTHSLTSTTLERGQWHDLDSRILNCMFDELVNFVEIEKAWMNVVCDEEKRKKYKPAWNATGWFRLRTWRSPAAGLDHLDWETTLLWDESSGVTPGCEGYNTPTGQSITAQEIKELYFWWKFIRPARKDPYDESGWTEICNKKRENGTSFWSGEDETPDEQEESQKSLDLLRQLEDSYDAEDEQMLIRLIKIRKSLWT